jgi:DNA-binding transcriptional MerR regulator
MASGPFTLAGLANAVGMSAGDVQYCEDRGLLPPPRRHPGRRDRLFFHAEHVERLTFVKHALFVGFLHDDIAGFIDPDSMVTCRDVYGVASQRLEALQTSGRADTREAICLAKLIAACPKVGGRKQCKILEGLSVLSC